MSERDRFIAERTCELLTQEPLMGGEVAYSQAIEEWNNRSKGNDDKKADH